ncbi:MAG: MBL fold metallo-hydrolase, partial [Candidatus Thorarchaeota archaeon]
IKTIIFDTGGSNLTFLHNLDIRGIPLYDLDLIVMSHWHYDHTGALIKILERLDDEVPIICHDSAKFERFFKRVRNLKNEELLGKPRSELSPLLSTSKIVNQEPINIDQVKNLKGQIYFTKEPYEIVNREELKILVSGEIPRIHAEEDFSNFLSLQDDIAQIDKILDDKCLILEFKENIVLLTGCCHSGLMNTLDYIKTLSNKPASHIIGGVHLARATDQRILNTLEYLDRMEKYENKVFVFPMHCSGEKVRQFAEKYENVGIHCYDVSVGTAFHFED